ncbi:hypothetical protein [Streptomyces sp. NBC_01718]|uniref:hypothetical protein n=1 Tax=Streptomyces sp. NBC_01718 TaxID=2975919 RepID=UPI00352C5511
MSSRTALYLTAAHAGLLLVIGLTILITGVLTDRRVGLVIEAGTTTTTIGVIATAITGYRALNAYIADRVALADSAALVTAIVQHDAQYCAPSTVVEFTATRRKRENAT